MAIFRSCPRFHPCPPYLQVSGRSDQNWMNYADDKVNQTLFQQSRGCNPRINDPIWTVFELIRNLLHVPLHCKFQEVPIKTEQVMLMTKSNRGFFSSQGEVTKINDLISLFQQSRGGTGKINVWIWPLFKLVQCFIHVHFICKFQAYPIKPERGTLMTKLNRGFFSNQGV